MQTHIWLVVWNTCYFENNHPNWLSYFSGVLKPPARYILHSTGSTNILAYVSWTIMDPSSAYKSPPPPLHVHRSTGPRPPWSMWKTSWWTGPIPAGVVADRFGSTSRMTSPVWAWKRMVSALRRWEILNLMGTVRTCIIHHYGWFSIAIYVKVYQRVLSLKPYFPRWSCFVLWHSETDPLKPWLTALVVNFSQWRISAMWSNIGSGKKRSVCRIMMNHLPSVRSGMIYVGLKSMSQVWKLRKSVHSMVPPNLFKAPRPNP